MIMGHAIEEANLIALVSIIYKFNFVFVLTTGFMRTVGSNGAVLRDGKYF